MKHTTPSGIDLTPHFMKLGPADYLKVPGRLLLFRDVHPAGQVLTELVQLDLAAGFAMFKATVTGSDGNVLAQAHGSETLKGFPGGYIEKSETVAVGRALAAAGFGTQFAAADFYDDGEHKLADAPMKAPAAPLPPSPPASKEAELKATQTQVGRIGAEVGRVGWSPDHARNWLMKHFNKQSRAQLTRGEAEALIAHLTTLPDAPPFAEATA